MATEVLIPKLGFSMNEGEVKEWLVEDGAAIKEGQPLYLLEAEKSANEIESPASGKLKILKPTGETYEVGTVIAVIE
jgi:pyruvate/2-oxoglutarate dehydrogenase complex dihydrolipoamide acyltransferase (E2) component